MKPQIRWVDDYVWCSGDGKEAAWWDWK